MGCSASKVSTRKRTARESWYAPVSRSSSAPIHFVADPADPEGDGKFSPSTPYSFTADKMPFGKGNKSSFASMLEEENLACAESKDSVSKDSVTTAKGVHDYHLLHSAIDLSQLSSDSEFTTACKPRKRIAVSKAHSKYTSLNPVAEVSECDNGIVDTINTWALMKETDEDDGRRRSSPPIRTTSNHTAFEKSLSFNKVYGLDSCFTEFNPPVCRRHFSEQFKEVGKELDFKGLTSDEENSLCMKQSESNSTSPSKSPCKSPSRTPWKQSPLKSPIRSPLKSPLMGSSSPLFDPSLLAKFEQAVDAIALPHDECFTCSNNEGSMTTSSYNHTWGSSETSSEGESPQSTLVANSLIQTGMLPSCYKDADTSCELDNFEIRCPHKGEDKVVLYFTSLRGVRKTYEDCRILRRILQGLGVHMDERDVWMHSKFREELSELLDKRSQHVPRLFIKGRYIGGVEEVCQLHEEGKLTSLVDGMPYFGTFRKACERCADMRFVPCFTCHGSCKVLDDDDQVMRCSDCNENGLMLCPLCS